MATAMEYYSFEKVLKELQMEENELKRLVSEGEIRAFRDEDKMKFRKSDIDGLKKGRMTEPTIILPSGEPDDSSEDSEVLLVEEDTSETLLDIDDLDGAESSSTSVPTVDLSASEFDESSASETITEELTFEEDSGSYVLESSDDVLIDSSEELAAIDDSDGEGETFIDSDTGLQTEPLDMDSVELNLGTDSDLDLNEPPMMDELSLQPLDESDEQPRVAMTPTLSYVEPLVLQPALMFCLIAATVVLLVSGMFVVNIIQEVDTPATGWLTDIAYEMAPAKYLYKRGQVPPSKLKKHMMKRQNWRKSGR